MENATHYHVLKREETVQFTVLQTTTGSYFRTMVARWQIWFISCKNWEEGGGGGNEQQKKKNIHEE